MKKKRTTALLALMFGVLGVHRFYLGQKFKGVLYFIFWGVMFVATVEENAPFIMAPALLAFVDAVLFFVMPKEDFDEKYNKKYIAKQDENPRRRRYEVPYEPPRRRPKPINTFKESGLRSYDEYDIIGAISDFKKALNANFKDSQVHFYLACCYSINEEPEKALFHLDKAVDFGFVDFDKIHNYDALAYLRTHNRFEEFVKNSYQIPRYLPLEQDKELDEMPDEKAVDLLDQIAELGKLYEKGILTADEFQEQKQKLFISK